MAKADLPEDEVVRLRVEEHLTLRQIASRYGVSQHPIRRVLHERGIRGHNRWTEEEALDALRAYQRERGLPPTNDTWKHERRKPAARVYAEMFGSWTNALVAAGLDGRAPGDSRTPDEIEEFDRESAELQARVDAGALLQDLAAELGVTPQSVGRRLAGWRAVYGAEGHRVPRAGRRS